jgi:hypothetical protein
MVVSLALIVSVVFPTALPVNASEKCLASFADSEWADGTPSGVRSLLGVDLVEKITKTPEFMNSVLPAFAPVNTFFVFGEYTESLNYNYVGRNCTSRNIVVSKVVNEQSVGYKYQTINERIDAEAENFLVKQNSITFYDDLKKYLSSQTFEVINKKSENSSSMVISRFIEQELTKFDRKVVSLGSHSDWFLYFPSKCGSFMERVTPGHISPFPFAAPLNWAEYRPIDFKSDGPCKAELRIGGQYSVVEKIADVKYFVKGANSQRTITCKKGKITKKVQGANPKCPSGFKKT